MNTHPSQANVILRELREHAPSWVEMPVLAAASCAYAVHSRVAELRRKGYPVECRVETSGRRKRSFYRLAV